MGPDASLNLLIYQIIPLFHHLARLTAHMTTYG